MSNIVNQRNKAYLDLVLARKELAYFIAVCSGALPKKLVTTRKSHKKANFIAKKTGKPRQSKWTKLNMLKMKAELNFIEKEQIFKELLKDFTVKGGSIKDVLGERQTQKAVG